MDVETEKTTAPFVELHNKILCTVPYRLRRIKKTHELSRAKYETLDCYYPLGEALEKKLAESASRHDLLKNCEMLLNAEIIQQFSSDISRAFGKKKRAAKKYLQNFPVQRV